MARESKQGVLLRMELRSDPELLSVVRCAIERLAVVVGLAEGDGRQVTLAVNEALANIMRHAYQNRRGQPIELTCRRVSGGASGRRADGLEFLLVDHGRGASPGELRGRPLGELRPGGLGLHFIQESMDEVAYERSGGRNRLCLVKYLSGRKSRRSP